MFTLLKNNFYSPSTIWTFCRSTKEAVHYSFTGSSSAPGARHYGGVSIHRTQTPDAVAVQIKNTVVDFDSLCADE